MAMHIRILEGVEIPLLDPVMERRSDDIASLGVQEGIRRRKIRRSDLISYVGLER